VTEQPEGWESFGYARVSLRDQSLDLQLDAFDREGIRKERIYSDKASGLSTKRAGLTACLRAMRKGDVLCVWKLDRLGRSVPELIKTVEALRERGIEVRSLTQPIDTTNPLGKMFFYMTAAFAEMERDLIVERTLAGQAAARDRGVKFGRKSVMSPEVTVRVRELLIAGKKPPAISKALASIGIKIGSSTIYKYQEALLAGADLDENKAGETSRI